MSKAILGYLMCPISPSNGWTTSNNLQRAKGWLHLLRTITRDLRWGGRYLVIAAPYIAAIEAGANEASEVDRAHGLRDDCAIVERFDFVIAAGFCPGSLLTSGMSLERGACHGPMADLMGIDPLFSRAWHGHRSVRDQILQEINNAIAAFDAAGVEGAQGEQ